MQLLFEESLIRMSINHKPWETEDVWLFVRFDLPHPFWAQQYVVLTTFLTPIVRLVGAIRPVCTGIIAYFGTVSRGAGSSTCRS